MSDPRWTFEVPPPGDGAAGLEGWHAQSRDQVEVGTVVVAVEHDGERFLVVEEGRPPLGHSYRLVPWEHVRQLDADALEVELDLAATEIASLPEADPARGVDPGLGSGAGSADAHRVTELPGRPAVQEPTGPGRAVAPTASPPRVFGALATSLVGALAFLLAIVAFAASRDLAWLALLAVPAVLWAWSAVLWVRSRRRPYGPR